MESILISEFYHNDNSRNPLEENTCCPSTNQYVLNKVVQVWTEILTCPFSGCKFPAEWLEISIDAKCGSWRISSPLKVYEMTVKCIKVRRSVEQQRVTQRDIGIALEHRLRTRTDSAWTNRSKHSWNSDSNFNFRRTSFQGCLLIADHQVGVCI